MEGHAARCCNTHVLFYVSRQLKARYWVQWLTLQEWWDDSDGMLTVQAISESVGKFLSGSSTTYHFMNHCWW